MVLPRDYFRYYILNKRIEILHVDLIVQTTLTNEDMEEVKLRFEVKVPGNCHRVLLDMKRNGYQKTSTQKKHLFLRQLIPTIKLLRNFQREMTTMLK